jgi:2-Cys peroxiredoxin 5
MNAWGKSLDADKKSGIRFLGDASGHFTQAWDLEFPAAAMLGTDRSKRYAITTLDGKVKTIAIEPDNTGANGKTHTWRITALND